MEIEQTHQKGPTVRYISRKGMNTVRKPRYGRNRDTILVRDLGHINDCILTKRAYLNAIYKVKERSRTIGDLLRWPMG
jgi:hypothetical protein